MAEVSRAKRLANNKWDKENMKIVACKVKKEHAESFKAYAESRSTSPNALLKDYIMGCIGELPDKEEVAPDQSEQGAAE